jgi:hypothetical protein
MAYKPLEIDLSGRVAVVTGANREWAKKPRVN